MYTEAACAKRWTTLLAPERGDVKAELESEVAAHLGMTVAAVESRIAGAADQFKREWQQRVTDPSDEQAVARFYNETDSELFELVGWHASDPIHYRTLMCLDAMRRFPVRTVLDFGSGIGSDALVLALSGYDVTLADVSDPLRRFAEWRCERRGYRVRSIDLKCARLPERAYDAVICFDVLE